MKDLFKMREAKGRPPKRDRGFVVWVGSGWGSGAEFGPPLIHIPDAIDPEEALSRAFDEIGVETKDDQLRVESDGIWTTDEYAVFDLDVVGVERKLINELADWYESADHELAKRIRSSPAIDRWLNPSDRT